MAPTLLFDLDRLDLDRVTHGIEAIEQVNPHREPMRLRTRR